MKTLACITCPTPHSITNHVRWNQKWNRADLEKEREKVTNGRIHLVKKFTLGRLLIDLFLCGGPRSYQVLDTSASAHSNGKGTKMNHLVDKVAPDLDTGHVNDLLVQYQFFVQGRGSGSGPSIAQPDELDSDLKDHTR